MNVLKKTQIWILAFFMVLSLFSCANDEEEKTEETAVSNFSASTKYMEEMYNDSDGETLNDTIKGDIYTAYPNKVQAAVNLNLDPIMLKAISYPDSNAETRGIGGLSIPSLDDLFSDEPVPCDQVNPSKITRTASSYKNWYQGVNYNADTLKSYLQTEKGAGLWLGYKLFDESSISSKIQTRGYSWDDFKQGWEDAKNIGNCIIGSADCNSTTDLNQRLTNEFALNAAFRTEVNDKLDNIPQDTAAKVKEELANNFRCINENINSKFDTLSTDISDLSTDIGDLRTAVNESYEKFSEENETLITNFQAEANEQFLSLNQGQLDMQDQLYNIDMAINKNIGLSYDILETVYGEKLRDAKTLVQGLITTLANFESIDDTTRIEEIKEFIIEAETLTVQAYQSAIDAHKTRLASGDFYDDVLIMPIADMLFFKQLSLLRLQLVPEVYSGDDLIKFRANVATNDMERSQLMKASIDAAFTYSSIIDDNDDEQFVKEYVDFLIAAFASIASWEIILQAHIIAGALI